MTTSPQMHDFARRLLRGTEQGTVNWETTDSSSGFIVQGTSGSTILRSDSFSGDDHPFRLVVLDTEGNTVEELRSDPTRSGPFADWEQDLAKLWVLARDQARGITSVLNDLTEEFGLPDADDIPF